MKKKIQAYVVHIPFLDMRKQSYEALMSKLESGLQGSHTFTWNTVSKYGPDAITQELIAKYVSLEQTGVPQFDMHLKSMHVRHISNTLNHYEALREGSTLSDDVDYIMVVEDDVLSSEHICERLQSMLTDFDTMDDPILFLGMPTSSSSGSADTKAVGTNNYQVCTSVFDSFPTCDSYIVKRSFLNQLVQNFLPIRFKSNTQLAYVIKHVCKSSAVSAIPNVMVDGSKYGVFVSTLDTNNRLFMNPLYNRCAQTMFAGPREDDDVAKCFANLGFQDNPDVKYLFALHELQRKRYPEAKKLMDECFEAYQNNYALLNSESEFMYNYMNIFKHFQQSNE